MSAPGAWLALTLLAYALALLAGRRWRGPLLNPTLLSTVTLVAALLLSGVPYREYAADTRPITALLGPAVTALAVPLYTLRALLRRQWRALLLGSVSGTALAVGVLLLVGMTLPSAAAEGALMTAPVTSPVALELARLRGAPEALAAVLAISSGLLGATVLPGWLRLLGVRDPLARGLAVGSVSHGIGTARAREEGELAGAASSLAMGLAVGTVSVLSVWQ